jgi:hypothetical protein
MDGRTRGWLAFGLGAGAVVWALALVLGAFLVPAYGGDTCEASPGSPTVCGSLPPQTLFAVNGWWVVELLLGVVAITALAFWALHVYCATGARRAHSAAIWLIALLAIFSIVSGFSIGFYVVPAALLLFASAALTPERGPRDPSPGAGT